MTLAGQSGDRYPMALSSPFEIRISLIYRAEFGPRLPHGRWSPANWLLHNRVRKRHGSRHRDSENPGGAVVSYSRRRQIAVALSP